MILDSKGKTFIQAREGLDLCAYLDVAGVPTIGYGTTIYPGGNKVKIGDVCTKEQAEEYFTHDVRGFEQSINKYIIISAFKNVLEVPALTQNQFNALVSFQYNTGGIAGSTLRKTVNSKDRNNKSMIQLNFLSWNKVRENGKLVPSDGLTNRRKKEVELYFS